jgi:hypothetical protein
MSAAEGAHTFALSIAAVVAPLVGDGTLEVAAHPERPPAMKIASTARHVAVRPCMCGLTLEMSGGWRHTKCAGGLPLD